MFEKMQPVLSPLRDDAFGGAGGGAAPSKGSGESTKAQPGTEQAVAPVPIPQELAEEMSVVKGWASANEKEARTDKRNYWVLKVPAIVVSASAALFVYFKVDALAITASAVASACALIDALQPRGMLYRAHKRASNDFYKLHSSMASQWRAGALGSGDKKALAAKIINDSSPEKNRVSKYLTEAESALSDSSRTLPEA